MARHYRLMSFAARDARAEAERAAGIPDRISEDFRTSCTIDLRGSGGPLYVLEPRRGYVAWRVVADGKVQHCASLKQCLHWIADQQERCMAMRHWQ
jgi:hypothetical protein